MIDGTKTFIGNGGIADIHVVNATVDPELGHYAQAMFIEPSAAHDGRDTRVEIDAPA
ncbi:MAG: hypothetical protein H0U80_00210 [Solirubrobacterales bacterium]|nr:hypothetical protein [Solirubrobacterales bacterium]